MPFKDENYRKEYSKSYREKNKEYLSRSQKEKRKSMTEEQKEKLRERRRAWREKNKDDVNKKRRERKQENKKILVDMMGGKCVGCGTTENLQFDHIDRRNKSFCISTELASKLDKLMEEALKCQLLCETCHKIKTTINHDTEGMANGKKVISVEVIEGKTIVILQ